MQAMVPGTTASTGIDQVRPWHVLATQPATAAFRSASTVLPGQTFPEGGRLQQARSRDGIHLRCCMRERLAGAMRLRPEPEVRSAACCPSGSTPAQSSRWPQPAPEFDQRPEHRLRHCRVRRDTVRHAGLEYWKQRHHIQNRAAPDRQCANLTGDKERSRLHTGPVIVRPVASCLCRFSSRLWWHLL